MLLVSCNAFLSGGPRPDLHSGLLIILTYKWALYQMCMSEGDCVTNDTDTWQQNTHLLKHPFYTVLHTLGVFSLFGSFCGKLILSSQIPL